MLPAALPITARPSRSPRAWLLAVLCLGAFAGPVSAAHATVSPPLLDESPSPAAVQVGGITTLGFTITNPDGTSLSGIGVSETLPAGLQMVNGSGQPLSGDAFKDCSGQGSVTVDPTADTITLTGLSLVAGGQCFFGVDVKALTAGSKSVTSSAITSTESGPGATATATVDILGPPLIATAFAAPSVLLGATTNMSYTLTDANAATQTGVAFSDTLPLGLTIATPNNLASTCGGTLVANAGASSVSLSSASITGNSTCTITVDVVAGAAGTLVNTTGSVSSGNGGTGTTAQASLLVVQLPTLSTSFTNAAIVLGTTTTASFTVHNPNSGSSLSGIGFSDTLPTGLAVATPNNLTGTCGGGTITATAGSATIGLSGATLAANASCTVTVGVVGATTGAKTNTTGAITSTESGNGATASASINVFGPPTIAASFADPSIALGATSTLSFTIANPAANAGAVHGIGFSGTLPAGLAVATPNGLIGTCGGGTISATAGASSVSLASATLAAGAQCTFSIGVVATAVGNQTLTTTHVISSEGGTGTTASASIDVAIAPSLHIAFTPSSIATGATTSLGYTVTNTNDADLSGVAFTDTLPGSITITSPNGATGTCGGGSITAVQGTSEVDLSGATVAAHTSCTFSVAVTSSTLGSHATTTSSVTSSNGGTGAAANASLLVLQAPTLGLAFADAAIGIGHTTTATFTIQNPNPSTALSGVGVSDTLPAGLLVATPSGQVSTCGGSLSAPAAGAAITLAGAAVPANGSCTVSVNVLGTSAGTETDTTAPITAAQTGAGAGASGGLLIFGTPSFSAAFGAASMSAGATTTLTFTLTGPAANPGDLHGVGFEDALPAGLVVASPAALNGGCRNGTVDAADGATDVNLSGALLSPGETCSFSVNVRAVSGGPQDNVTGRVTTTEAGTGPSASAAVDVPQGPSLAVGFGAPVISLNALTAITFTLGNPNPVALTGVGFTDTLPAGLVVVVLKPVTAACGGSVGVAAGNGGIVLSGATLAADGTCSFSLFVSGSTLGDKANVTGAPTSLEGGAGSPASALVTVVNPVTATTTTTAPPPPPTAKKKKTTKAPVKPSCVVPKLSGRTVNQAKTLLTHGHCALGKVTRKKVHGAHVRRITHQALKAGSRHGSGAHVAVIVAK
jgi:hypothetical protein